MKDEIFAEMAQKVIDKLDEKINSISYNQNLQVEVDTFKAQGLIDDTQEDDLYFSWFKKEFYEIVEAKDTYKIHLISAVIAYLAFLDSYPLPKELRGLSPFEIFYKVYEKALKVKKMIPITELKLED